MVDGLLADRDPQRTRRVRLSAWLRSATLALTIVGCGSAVAPSTTPAVPSGSSQECGAPSFPCTFAAADEQVRQQSEALAADIAGQMRDGVAPDAIETSVRSMDGVAVVEAEPGAVRFRMTGGRPEWIVDDPTIGRGDGIGAAAFLSARRVAGSVVAAPAVFHSIAGPPTPDKHALVLSPFLWDFGPTDDGAQVAAILGDTRGYTGGVTSAANAHPGDQTVGIKDFKGWTSDAVVHVVSHGVRLCKTAPCRAVIVVRLLSGDVGGQFVGTRGLELDPSDADQTGVDVVHTVDGLTLLALDADFFRHEYPAGVANAVVFFNACETFGAEATDLADAIRGNSGDFLGWSERVSSAAALNAALAFYPLVASGRTTREALDGIGNLAVDAAAPNAQLNLGSAVVGGLRIRDLATPLQPSTDQPLAPSGALPIEGAMADGQADSVPWRIAVDGFDSTEAGTALLHVAIDNLTAPVVAVSTGSQGSGTQWFVAGRIELGADLVAPRPANLTVSVDLPEGGVSRTEMPVTIGGNERPTGTVWTIHVTRAGPEELGTIDTTLTIDATVEFAGIGPGQSLQYLVTDGTYHWTYGPSASGGCTWSAEPVSGTLTPENTSGSLGLAFYQQGSSIAWSAFITFEGNETARTIECGPDSLFESSRDTIRASGSVLFPPALTLGTLKGDSDTGNASDADGKVSISWTIKKIR